MVWHMVLEDLPVAELAPILQSIIPHVDRYDEEAWGILSVQGGHVLCRIHYGMAARKIQKHYKNYRLRRLIERRIIRKRLLQIMNSPESQQKIFAPDRLRSFLCDADKRLWRMSIDFAIDEPIDRRPIFCLRKDTPDYS